MVHNKQERRSVLGNHPPPPRTVLLPLGYNTSESESSDSESSSEEEEEAPDSERERRHGRSRSNSRHRGGGGGSLAESKDADVEPYYTGDTTFSTAFVLSAEVVPTLVRDADGEYYSFPTTDGFEFRVPCGASLDTVEAALNEHVPPDCAEHLAVSIGFSMASNPIAELRGLALTTVADVAPGVFVIDTTTGRRHEQVTMFSLGEHCEVGNGADDADDDADDDDADSDPRRTSFGVSLYVLADDEEYAARIYFEDVESLRALMTPRDYQRLLHCNRDHLIADSPQ